MPVGRDAGQGPGGDHPLRRTVVGLRGGRPVARPGAARGRRAGARHLLRLPGDGPGARRHGRAHRAARVRRARRPTVSDTASTLFDGQPADAVGVDEPRRLGLRGARGLRRSPPPPPGAGRRVRGRRAPALRRAVAPRGACTRRSASGCSRTSCCAAPGSTADWTAANVIDEQVAAIREQVGDGPRASARLSGGVDSAVAAALVQQAVGDQLTCVFVDHGLLRAGEAEQVEKDFVAATGVDLVVVDAREQFLDRARRRHRPRGEAQDHRPRVHPRLRAGGARRRRLGRRRRAPGRVPRAGHALPRRRRVRRRHRHGEHQDATTTSAACRTTCSSSSSSRCARCSRTRCARSASSSACPR